MARARISPVAGSETITAPQAALFSATAFSISRWAMYWITASIVRSMSRPLSGATVCSLRYGRLYVSR